MHIIRRLQKLTSFQLWLLSIFIAVVMTEIIVCGMEMLLKGEITYDYLLTGFVASLCVAGVVIAGLTFFLSQQRQAEEALKNLVEILEQRVTEEVAKNMVQERILFQQSRLAAMGEMIGNIAHQWRQPLNALGLLLQNTKDAYEFNELNQECLNVSTATGMRLIAKMSSTIDDFRNFYKPNREKTRFNLKDAVENTLAILFASFEHHNIHTHVEADGDIVAYGFPNEYSQVLLNILNNAKDAMLANKVAAGEICIGIARQGNQARVTVRDNAGGINADILPKIFDPYFTTKEKGAGIGLYMSKMIIEDNMGGKIEARNVEGGAEFVVDCPVGEG